MNDDWWVDGPPERFEVGMKVADYESGGVIVTAVFGEGGLIAVADPLGYLKCWEQSRVRSHCPMMPRREAEEMAIALVEDVAGDYDVCVYTVEKHPDRVRQDWRRRLAEWRERRAGDETRG